MCDYMKLLWPHVAELHCRQCGQPVHEEPPRVVWEKMNAECGVRSAEWGEGGRAPEVIITFELPLSEKLSLEESLALIAKQGYQRLLLDGQVVRLDDPAIRKSPLRTQVTVVQDRIKLATANRARFVEACEQAYHFGKGKLAIQLWTHGRARAWMRHARPSTVSVRAVIARVAISNIASRRPRSLATTTPSVPARCARVLAGSSPSITIG
jgi:excinuclease ABC subunit A